MSDLEHHYISGIRCDVCGTRRHAEGGTDEKPVLLRRWDKARDAFYEAAAADGWQRWISRSTRDYCPEHRPKPGHHMRRLW